jgi:hypothetical protein
MTGAELCARYPFPAERIDEPVGAVYVSFRSRLCSSRAYRLVDG